MDETVWARWERHASDSPTTEILTCWRVDAEPVRWTWGSLLSAARAAALCLSRSGVRRGDVCAVMMRCNSLVYPVYMGVAALGAVPSVLAYPNARLHKDKFIHGLVGMARRSGLRWVLTERDLEETVRPLVSASDSTVASLLFPLEFDFNACGTLDHAGSIDDVCLLQHSSGTTGLQKAVALSHRAVLDHVTRYGAAIDLRADDRVASWLPLYHDMGLIAAFHLPLAAGIPSVQMDAFEWVSAPATLLEVMTTERATLCWLPNFAYNLMANRVREDDLAGVDLGRLRLAINCSEPVRADSHERFLKRFAPQGLRATALGACYAMAEATFAVTQTDVGRSATVLQADRAALSDGRYEPSRGGHAVRACVSSGRPISGCEIRIVSDDGSALPEGRVGEIIVRSVSLFSGYKNDPELTSQVLRDGWYFTGDYGFLCDGECFVVGRKKDLIIVAGKNLYPEDVEDAVGQVSGVIAGRVVAFGEEDVTLGTEAISVIAETSAESARERKALRLEIVRSGMAIDVTIDRVYLAPPRWLIKSSSGKPSRHANRDRRMELTEEG